MLFRLLVTPHILIPLVPVPIPGLFVQVVLVSFVVIDVTVVICVVIVAAINADAGATLCDASDISIKQFIALRRETLYQELQENGLQD